MSDQYIGFLNLGFAYRRPACIATRRIICSIFCLLNLFSSHRRPNVALNPRAWLIDVDRSEGELSFRVSSALLSGALVRGRGLLSSMEGLSFYRFFIES